MAYETHGGRPWVRWVLAGAGVLVLAVTVPAIPGGWASITAPGSVMTSASMGGGVVTVTGCSHAVLPLTWHCQGTFAYADPMAQGSQITRSVGLANDPHRYPRGAQVGVSLRPGTHRAYLWGDFYFAEIFLMWLGLALTVAGIAALVLARRRPVAWAAAGLLVIGIVCLLPVLHRTWPLTASAQRPAGPPGITPPPAIKP
jgi:hypothetical protein